MHSYLQGLLMAEKIISCTNNLHSASRITLHTLSNKSLLDITASSLLFTFRPSFKEIVKYFVILNFIKKKFCPSVSSRMQNVGPRMLPKPPGALKATCYERVPQSETTFIGGV